MKVNVRTTQVAKYCNVSRFNCRILRFDFGLLFLKNSKFIFQLVCTLQHIVIYILICFYFNVFLSVKIWSYRQFCNPYPCIELHILTIRKTMIPQRSFIVWVITNYSISMLKLEWRELEANSAPRNIIRICKTARGFIRCRVVVQWYLRVAVL